MAQSGLTFRGECMGGQYLECGLLWAPRVDGPFRVGATDFSVADWRRRRCAGIGNDIDHCWFIRA